MKVTVSKNNIKKGCANDPMSCPIALSLKDKHLGNPVVDTEEVVVTIRGKRHTYTLPETASAFIFRFDEGLYVKPFTFELRNEFEHTT